MNSFRIRISQEMDSILTIQSQQLNIQKNKLVIFGAGKIGRSFIGQLFSTGGYEVVFIDIIKPLIDELNRRGNYNVVIKSQKN